MSIPSIARCSRDVFYRFYAAEFSYFSAKVRPALRYKRIPYVELLPTPEAYRDVHPAAHRASAFIPIVVTADDETLQDTSEILDALEQRFPDPPLYPRDAGAAASLAYLIELYADEFLILPGAALPLELPESAGEARADFAAINGEPRWPQRIRRPHLGHRCRFVGVVPESIPAIEAHTRELLDALSAHFGRHPYLLGGSPVARRLRAHGAALRPSLPRRGAVAAAARDGAAGLPLDPAHEQSRSRLVRRLGRSRPTLRADAAAAAGTDRRRRGPAAARQRARLRRVGGDAHRRTSSSRRAVSAVTRPRCAARRSTASPAPYTLWMVQRPLDVYRGARRRASARRRPLPRRHRLRGVVRVPAEPSARQAQLQAWCSPRERRAARAQYSVSPADRRVVAALPDRFAADRGAVDRRRRRSRPARRPPSAPPMAHHRRSRPVHRRPSDRRSAPTRHHTP